jgi:signal transduction histidine kinase/ActR/RegA family two-component response regulator
MIWGVVYPLLLFPAAMRRVLVVSIAAALLAVHGTALVLLRRGSLAGSSWVYLLGNLLVRTVAIALGGGAHAVCMVFYLVLPISAAWLLGLPAALLSAGLCMTCIVGLVLVEMLRGPLPLYFHGTPLTNAAALLQAMAIGTFPVARILQILQEALARSRTAEQTLQHYQAGLKELVRQRTIELEEARDQAQAANRAKSAFLATVSHELRSPLNTILLLSDPEWLDPGIPPAMRRDLHLIRRSGESLLHLIDDVLDSARIDSGNVTAVNADVDLWGLLHEVVDLIEMRAGEKRLDFLIHEQPDVPHFVTADGAKLRHILIRLMDNAIKYTDRGSVTFRVRFETADPAGWRLHFEIADTGIGIASEDQERIFEPFIRVGNSAARKGTGLGLSIVRQYVQAMGGLIRLESALEQGSRFFVELPVGRCVEQDEVVARNGSFRIAGLAPGQQEYRILIVDDRPEDRLVLRRILQEAGFAVQSAETGEAGIRLFKSWRPHFIWMDWRLPEMDGSEATRSIRALEGGREVIIAGLSASVFPSEREEMLASGVQDFVCKPYTPDEIFECMARHLGVRYDYAPATRGQSA